MKIKVDIGNGQTYKITQNAGDLKDGYNMNDYSRISAYRGEKKGLHTGTRSQTLARNGKPFKG